MSCPRPGEKCVEFACGSSIDGICMKRPLPPPPMPMRKVGMFIEENKNLADFKASVENIASMYAKIIENQLKDKESVDATEMLAINEEVRTLSCMLNCMANTIKRIDHLKD